MGGRRSFGAPRGDKESEENSFKVKLNIKKIAPFLPSVAEKMTSESLTKLPSDDPDN